MRSFLLAAFLFSLAGLLVPMPASCQDKTFSVQLAPIRQGSITLDPPLPESGRYKAGSVVTVRAKPEEGQVVDSIYYSVPGRWGAMYHESLTPEFKVTVDRDKTIGASFIEAEATRHVNVIHNVVYAQPGQKPLKYDVYMPPQADRLPLIVIIHGGGWSTNDEDIMRALARELTKGGKFVVASIDYRWIGKLDGDQQPNSMADLIEDVFGAIVHLREHAANYGADPTRIGVTGDSAGGHLSASAAVLIERIGDGGFGKSQGVYEFLPTYIPEDKTADQIRDQLLHSIKAAAPSYGVFSAASIRRFQNDLTDPAAEAVAPLSQIPESTLRAIPHYLTRGTLDFLIPDEPVAAYADALKAKGHSVVYDQVEGANHAFFDWKPNDEVKATFEKFGVPYAAKMRQFFEKHLH